MYQFNVLSLVRLYVENVRSQWIKKNIISFLIHYLVVFIKIIKRFLSSLLRVLISNIFKTTGCLKLLIFQGDQYTCY